jgi:hypothetical protein
MRVLLVAALAALGAGSAAQAARHDPEKMSVGHVRDLHFGDVLFYYFQDEDLEALTRLLAYEHWKLMPHHEDEAQLMAGALYLQLGMHNEAGEIFARLLNDNVAPGVRNRAWLYLAQIWYARGYLDKAEGALRNISGRMSPDLEAQKELLLANVLMHEDRYDEAIQLLAGWHGGPVWSAYARFNLGVALVRNKRLDDAAPFLSGVGSMLADTPEMAALRDRANLALGFAYLQAEQPAKARPALARVRLNGPYSNKALLGIGWADAQLGDYQAALTPWLELRNRDLLDAAVQESYLAVPYAFSKLSANSQSAEYYESAVKSFDTQSAQLDAAMDRIRKGELLQQVLAADQPAPPQQTPAQIASGEVSVAPTVHGWFRDVKKLPDSPEMPYLYALLAGHDFQEGVKNYRDLVYLDGTLERGSDSLVAFQDMIDTREHAYAERLPRTDALLASNRVAQLQQRNLDLQNQLRDIEAQHNVGALGNDTERDQWARLQRLEAALAAAPSTPDNAQLRARLALVKGVLYYRLNDAYAARLWQEQRGLKDLNLALQEAQSRWIRVQQARQRVPTNTGEFATRVAALRARLDALQVRLADAEKRQSAYLAQVAVHELEQQKARVETYQIQARFALATIYDRAAHPEHPPGKGPAPVQKGNDENAAPPSDQAPQPDATPQRQEQPQ